MEKINYDEYTEVMELHYNVFDEIISTVYWLIGICSK